MEGKIFVPFVTLITCTFFFLLFVQNSQISKPMNSKMKIRSCHAFLLNCWSWSLVNFRLKQGRPAGLFQNCSCLFTLYATNNPHKAHKMVPFIVNPWLLQFHTFSCTVHFLFCGGFFVLCITVRTKLQLSYFWWLDRENSKKSYHIGCVVYSPCVQTIEIWWFLSNFSFY